MRPDSISESDAFYSIIIVILIAVCLPHLLVVGFAGLTDGLLVVFVGFAALLVVFLLCLAVLLATLVVLVMLPVRDASSRKHRNMPLEYVVRVKSGHTRLRRSVRRFEHDSCSVASSLEGECLRHGARRKQNSEHSSAVSVFFMA